MFARIGVVLVWVSVLGVGAASVPPPDGWYRSCDDKLSGNQTFYDASDSCQCGCGIIDPDCLIEGVALHCFQEAQLGNFDGEMIMEEFNPLGQTCNLEINRCVPANDGRVWELSDGRYNDGEFCDATGPNGVRDPDCDRLYGDDELRCYRKIQKNLVQFSSQGFTYDSDSNSCVPSPTISDGEPIQCVQVNRVTCTNPINGTCAICGECLPNYHGAMGPGKGMCYFSLPSAFSYREWKTFDEHPLRNMAPVSNQAPTFVNLFGTDRKAAFFPGTRFYFVNQNTDEDPIFARYELLCGREPPGDDVLERGDDTSNDLNLCFEHASKISFADIDGDDDLDAIVSGLSRDDMTIKSIGHSGIYVYENIGSRATRPRFRLLEEHKNPLFDFEFAGTVDMHIGGQYGVLKKPNGQVMVLYRNASSTAPSYFLGPHLVTVQDYDATPSLLPSEFNVEGDDGLYFVVGARLFYVANFLNVQNASIAEVFGNANPMLTYFRAGKVGANVGFSGNHAMFVAYDGKLDYLTRARNGSYVSSSFAEPVPFSSFIYDDQLVQDFAFAVRDQRTEWMPHGFLVHNKRLAMYKNVPLPGTNLLEPYFMEVDTNEEIANIPELVGEVSRVLWTNFDKDDDFDLVVQVGLSIRYFENDEGTFRLAAPTQDPFRLVQLAHEQDRLVCLDADVNRDYQVDCFIVYFQTERFSLLSYSISQKAFMPMNLNVNPLKDVQVPKEGVVSQVVDIEPREKNLIFFDVDGDGDLDFLIGEPFKNHTLYINDFVQFREVSYAENPLRELILGHEPKAMDIDGDGKIDLAYIDQDRSTVMVLKNVELACSSECLGRGLCADSASRAHAAKESQQKVSVLGAIGLCWCEERFAGPHCGQCSDQYYGINCDGKCPKFSKRIHENTNSFPFFEDVFSACECEHTFMPKMTANEKSFECVCPPGTAFDKDVGYCVTCEKGTYKSTFSNKDVCSTCQGDPFGTTLTTGSTTSSCNVCKETFSQDPISGKCSCQPGWGFNSQTKRCQPCGNNSFKDTFGLHACAVCNGGMESVKGGTACGRSSNCPPGYERGDDGITCDPCKRNFYRADNSTDACVACPLEYPFTEYEGAASVEECVAGPSFFQVKSGSDRRIVSCANPHFEGKVDCSGQIGIKLESLPLLPGFWRISQSSVDIRECHAKHQCKGGNPFDNNNNNNNNGTVVTRILQAQASSYCSDNYQGHMCGECVDGFAMLNSNQSCVECTDEAMDKAEANYAGFLFVYVLVCALPWIVLLYKTFVLCRESKQDGLQEIAGSNPDAQEMEYYIRTHNNRRRSSEHKFRGIDGRRELFMEILRVKFMIAVGFFQVFLVYINATSSYVSLFIDFDPTVLWDAFEMGCKWELSYYDRMFLYTLVPFITCGLMAIYLVFTGFCDLRKHLVAGFTSMALFVCFLVYPRMGYVLSGAFATEDFFGSENATEPSYIGLKLDVQVNFESEESKMWRSYAIAMLVLYVVGVCGLFIVCVAYYKKRTAEKKITGVQIGVANVLVKQYRPSFEFFEAYELVRKLILSVTFLILRLNGKEYESQVFFLFACFVFLLLHVKISAYRSTHDQNLAEFSLLLLGMCAFFPDKNAVFVGIVTSIELLAFVLAIGFHWIGQTKEESFKEVSKTSSFRLSRQQRDGDDRSPSAFAMLSESLKDDLKRLKASIITPSEHSGMTSPAFPKDNEVKQQPSLVMQKSTSYDAEEIPYSNDEMLELDDSQEDICESPYEEQEDHRPLPLSPNSSAVSDDQILYQDFSPTPLHQV